MKFRVGMGFLADDQQEMSYCSLVARARGDSPPPRNQRIYSVTFTHNGLELCAKVGDWVRLPNGDKPPDYWWELGFVIAIMEGLENHIFFSRPLDPLKKELPNPDISDPVLEPDCFLQKTYFEG